jgi:ubiquitin-conjugating enzyme E2 O
VTVVWQNGANEENLSSTNLYPVHHIDDHDFFPGDFVVENKDFVEPFCYGVVQNSDFQNRVATVKWFNASQGSYNTPIFIAQKDVSVYDIKDHPDFNFRPACCVIRIPNNEEDGSDLLSRAGQIVEINLDGMLNCVWTNGQSSLVYPFHLFVIGDYVIIYFYIIIFSIKFL